MSQWKKLLIYFIIIAIFFSIIFFKKRGIKDYIVMHKRLEKLVEENRKIKKENELLKSEVKRLKSDLKYIEKIAREKYNMIKEDEILIKINKKREVKKWVMKNY